MRVERTNTAVQSTRATPCFQLSVTWILCLVPTLTPLSLSSIAVMMSNIKWRHRTLIFWLVYYSLWNLISGNIYYLCHSFTMDVAVIFMFFFSFCLQLLFVKIIVYLMPLVCTRSHKFFVHSILKLSSNFSSFVNCYLTQNVKFISQFMLPDLLSAFRIMFLFGFAASAVFC